MASGGGSVLGFGATAGVPSSNTRDVNPSSTTSAGVTVLGTGLRADVLDVNSDRPSAVRIFPILNANSNIKRPIQFANKPMTTATVLVAKPVSTSDAQAEFEVANNSILANPKKVSQVPVQSILRAHEFNNAYLHDMVDIPTSMEDEDWDVNNILTDDVPKMERSVPIPMAVVYALRNALLGCHPDYDFGSELSLGPEISDQRRAREMLEDGATIYDMLEEFCPVSIKRPHHAKIFFLRRKFPLTSGLSTDLVTSTFVFKNQGSPFEISRQVDLALVNGSSQPFANVGPNQDLARTHAQAIASLTSVYARHILSRVTVPDKWSPNPQSLYALVTAAAEQGRDWIAYAMGYESLASMFGFDGDNEFQRNQKGHIDTVAVVLESYRKFNEDFLDGFNLTLAAVDSHQRVNELIREPFSHESLIPATHLTGPYRAHVDVKTRRRRAFVPDPPHGPPAVLRDEEGQIKYGTSRLLFDCNKSEQHLDLNEALGIDLEEEFKNGYVVDPNDPTQSWVALPDRRTKRGRLNRAPTMLSYLIASIIGDLLQNSAAPRVLKQARRRYPAAYHRVIRPFLSDNGDEIKKKTLARVTAKKARAEARQKAYDAKKQELERLGKEKAEKAEVIQVQLQELEAQLRKTEEAEEKLEREKEELEDKKEYEEEDEEKGDETSEGSEVEEEKPRKKKSHHKKKKKQESSSESESETEQEEEEQASESETATATETDVPESEQDVAGGSATDTDNEQLLLTEHQAEEEEKIMDVMDYYAPSWRDIHPDDREILVYIARLSIKRPNKKPAPGQVAVIDPSTNKPMELAIRLDTIKGREYAAGLLQYLNFPQIMTRIHTLALFFRPRENGPDGPMRALRDKLDRIPEDERRRNPALYKIYFEPFDIHAQLRFVFRVFDQKSTYVPFSD